MAFIIQGGFNRRARSFSVSSLVFVWHLSFRLLIALLRTWSWLDWTGLDWNWMVRVDLGCVYFYFFAGVGGGEAGVDVGDVGDVGSACLRWQQLQLVAPGEVVVTRVGGRL
ncbi:hypothetical protein IWX49DRAFT_184609 [Phyllosticta citricarpa]